MNAEEITAKDPTLPAEELVVDFLGEIYSVSPGDSFTVGRDGDLVIDDNLFLHRHFLRFFHQAELWWVENIGSRLAATVSDTGGTMQSWLSPGSRLPLVFGEMMVVFSAGPTTYDIHLSVPHAEYEAPPTMVEMSDGEETIGQVLFTPSQLLIVIALAEPRLRAPGAGRVEVPPSQAAAARLGWTVTRFNRKLDNVCDKLDRLGVRGLRGGRGKNASNRRARLVEYALTSLLVTEKDLQLLDAEAAANGVSGRV